MRKFVPLYGISFSNLTLYGISFSNLNILNAHFNAFHLVKSYYPNAHLNTSDAAPKMKGGDLNNIKDDWNNVADKQSSEGSDEVCVTVWRDDHS